MTRSPLRGKASRLRVCVCPARLGAAVALTAVIEHRNHDNVNLCTLILAYREPFLLRETEAKTAEYCPVNLDEFNEFPRRALG